MNILWLNHRDPKNPRAGGAERTIYEVAKRLVQQGNSVTIYCPKWIGSPDREIMDGINIVRRGSSFSIHLLLPIFLIKNKFDIIIIDLAHGVPWIFPVLMKKNNVVFFRHLHSRSLPGQVNLILSKFITFLEKLYPVLYRNKKIVTESISSEEDLIKLGFSKENIIKIAPGVDLNMFKTGKKSQSVQLVYFGGIRKYKRPEFSIEVYEELREKIKDLKLVITGNGPLLRKMKEDVNNKNYNIDFLGRIDSNQLSRIVSESWINLHFSVTEGWGYSILESSASGTPTVAFRVPGVIDTLKDNINGFLVDDISEFRDKILYIIGKEDIFINNSRKFAENFTWEKTVSKWNEVLQNEVT